MVRSLGLPIIRLTHLCLVSHKGTLANSMDPDQTPQNAVSDQGLHCLQLGWELP